eukprot:6425475-Pyramimonas_sp.AAC.1
MQVRDCDFIDVAPGAVAAAQMIQSQKPLLISSEQEQVVVNNSTSEQVRSTEIQTITNDDS